MVIARIGISGWSYEEWSDGLYRGVARPRWLEQYASVFPTVEALYTARHRLTAATAARWRHATGAGFRFAVKAPPAAVRRHQPDAGPFLLAVRQLQDRLGPVLVQVQIARDDEWLTSALRSFAGLEMAFEFRHSSWFDDRVKAKLAQSGAAWVGLESDGRESGTGGSQTHPYADLGSFAYLRLRRSGYSEGQLSEWAERIRSLPVEIAWVYFRHSWEAPGYARRLIELLDA